MTVYVDSMRALQAQRHEYDPKCWFIQNRGDRASWLSIRYRFAMDAALVHALVR